MFSGVEKMVKSMRAAQETRFAAERTSIRRRKYSQPGLQTDAPHFQPFSGTYDAYLKQKGQRPPMREKPQTDSVRWWEWAFALTFASAIEWQFDLLGLRTRVNRERRKWGLDA